jgi:rubrerythrin
MKESALGFCYNCPDYPCKRLVKLDASYREKYRMSMLGNLEYIIEHGMEDFLRFEEKRWTCKKCGSVLCVHREACPTCREPYEAISEQVSSGA